jgi:hypothetical protein
MNIVLPNKIAAIIRKDGLAEREMLAWMQAVTLAIKELEIIEGDGSPEGVVFASKKKQYYDNTGSPGSRLYIKTTANNLDTGWELIG